MIEEDNYTISPENLARNYKPHELEMVTCQICLMILENPIECTQCQNPFCQKCIERFKKG